MVSRGGNHHRDHPGGGIGARVALLAVLLPALAAPPVSGRQNPEQDEAAYRQAVDLTVLGEWQQAVEIFRRLARGETPRAAESAFYTGLCLENLSGRDAEAFEAFEDTRRRFPDSAAAGKALLRQLTLAGVLGFSDTRYRDFLVDQLQAADPAVCNEAALSLARLGDERAVDRLLVVAREGSPTQRMMVLEMAANFDAEAATRLLDGIAASAADPELKSRAVNLKASVASRTEERAKSESILAKDVRALMEEIRRQGETWTDEELIIHGLFHIMERQEFVRYVQSNAAGRRRAYADFWAGIKDPIPQTPQNELEEEFRRRLQVAHRLYGEPWKAARSRYDAKEWLTPDSPYCPWDARGELLIKFGEPSDVFLVGFNQEEWYYSNLKVDFTVSLYRYNYFRNAIFPGRASQMDYPPGYVPGYFIKTPRIDYNPSGR
jgi:hypothetical protein